MAREERQESLLIGEYAFMGRDSLKLAASVVACELVGVAGAVFTTPAIPGWYASLSKPWFTPPGWVFAPVWTLLYLLMGVAAFRVWRLPNRRERNRALGLFGVQLFLNFLWSLVFFGMRSPALGVAIIVLLWLAVAATMRAFWKLDRKAAWLLAPYLAWVSFAALLNVAVWMLN